MIQEYLKAFSLIFMAEMGDKTQILAMAFATQYPVLKVLTGIGIGAFLNHGLAVLLGSLLSTIIDIEIMQIVAGFAFVGFGLWTLKIENDEEEDKSQQKYGPILTVSIAFFIGELGDKTQLTAITLSTEALYPFIILLGTVSGMIATGALGIYVGKKLGDKIPELIIKYLASSVFLLFGFLKLNSIFGFSQYLYAFYAIVIISALFLAVKLNQQHKLVVSQFRLTSQKLYDYYQHVSIHLDEICMGERYCNACLGEKCAIGHAKQILKDSLDEGIHEESTPLDQQHFAFKPFDHNEVLHVLADTIKVIEDVKDEKRNQNAQLIRQQLEMILLNKTLVYKDTKDYLHHFSQEDEGLSLRLRGLLAQLKK